jgi:hypothetical protein
MINFLFQHCLATGATVPQLSTPEEVNQVNSGVSVIASQVIAIFQPVFQYNNFTFDIYSTPVSPSVTFDKLLSVEATVKGLVVFKLVGVVGISK